MKNDYYEKNIREIYCMLCSTYTVIVHNSLSYFDDALNFSV